jgi:hypothetical protein
MKQPIDELAEPSNPKNHRSRQALLCLGLGVLAVLGIVWSVERSRQPLAEGVIWSVEWTAGGGKSEGLTRSNVAQAVPGGNGSWGVNMLGKLYPTHLEITFPDANVRGPQIIPLDRLVGVTFGGNGEPQKSVANR